MESYIETLIKMASRNRVFPMKSEGQDENDMEFRGTQTNAGKMANALNPHSSNTVELRQCIFAQSSLNPDQDASRLFMMPQGDNECKIRPPSSAGGFMKRRNSNLANCEKMLQEIGDSTNDMCRRDIKENEAILEWAEDIYCFELDNTKVSVGKEEALSCRPDLKSECDGKVKPEDPNQALLQYFARLSGSGCVDESLDWEHIQSLLRKGASVNTSDRFGQSLLHEVSRTWGIEVAQFFIEQSKATDL